MESCAATNNPQYYFAGIGLMAASGVLDAVCPTFMKAGYKKFDPDRVSQPISGEYNKKDVFNAGMLLQCAESYSTSQSYNSSNFFH